MQGAGKILSKAVFLTLLQEFLAVCASLSQDEGSWKIQEPAFKSKDTAFKTQEPAFATRNKTIVPRSLPRNETVHPSKQNVLS